MLALAAVRRGSSVTRRWSLVAASPLRVRIVGVRCVQQWAGTEGVPFEYDLDGGSEFGSAVSLPRILLPRVGVARLCFYQQRVFEETERG